MNKKSKVEQLADLIEANKSCQFDIDNDMWFMVEPLLDDMDDEEPKEITDSDKIYWDTNWYSGSNQYGAGIAEALVILLNRRGFNIKASAV